MVKLQALVSAILALSGASALAADPMQWSGNGHWYLYVGDAVTAPTAFERAAAMTWQGLQGHLATVTSESENIFVSVDVAGSNLVWLGASDGGAANVDDWTWRVGPEAGQALTYTNWNGGEPNNCCGGEDYLHTNWGGPTFWNDHGGPGNPGQVNGFVVEFSAPVPEPATWGLMTLGLVATGALARRRRAG